MIVGLVRPDGLRGRWYGFDFEYSQFLAHRLAAGAKSTVIELDVRKQIFAAETLKLNKSRSHQHKWINLEYSREELLTKSQILDVCTSDILVVDFRLRTDQDLKDIEIWANAICELSKVVVNTPTCPCDLLHHAKKIYAVVTMGETDIAEDREQIRLAIEKILKPVGMTQLTFFFRSFAPLVENSIAPSSALQIELLG